MWYYDAHNHLQDARLDTCRDEIMHVLFKENIASYVVNGTSEMDWESVHEIASAHARVIPSYGLHPWYVNDRSDKWFDLFLEYLKKMPSAIGEVGLDRSVKDYNQEAQESVFISQLAVAAERNLPLSIHCVKAWGRLLEILKSETLPDRGFLLHSYGGSLEMLDQFASLGAYFSFSASVARKENSVSKRLLGHIPIERILLETDAPDILPPDDLLEYYLEGDLNHPANISGIYRYVAGLLETDLALFGKYVEENFKCFFGDLVV